MMSYDKTALDVGYINRTAFNLGLFRRVDFPKAILSGLECYDYALEAPCAMPAGGCEQIVDEELFAHQLVCSRTDAIDSPPCAWYTVRTETTYNEGS